MGAVLITDRMRQIGELAGEIPTGKLAQRAMSVTGRSPEDWAWIPDWVTAEIAEHELPEFLQGLSEDCEFMRGYCRAVIDRDEAKIKDMFSTLQDWHSDMPRGTLFRVAGLKTGKGYVTSQIVSSFLPDGPNLFDLRAAIRYSFVTGLMTAGDEQVQARQLLKGIEEKKDMVTIAEVAELVGMSVNTVRWRIYQAREHEGLTVRTVRGAILVDREKGLQIARRPKYTHRKRASKVLSDKDEKKLDFPLPIS